MACSAHGHGTIRLHELAVPSLIEWRAAALIAWYIPKSSRLMMSTRASGGKPSSSLDRTKGAVTAGSIACPSMPPVSTLREKIVELCLAPQMGDAASQHGVWHLRQDASSASVVVAACGDADLILTDLVDEPVLVGDAA